LFLVENGEKKYLANPLSPFSTRSGGARARKACDGAAGAEKPASPETNQRLSLNFARNRPAGLKFEPGLVMSKGDLVMVHSRYTGFGPNPMVIVDILRVRKGKLVEHWDIMQEEVPADKSANGNTMFPIR
jgi:hypothetical protein